MKLETHFLISFAGGGIYCLFGGKSFSFVNLFPWLLGGVLIDIDHLFTYGVKQKTLNFKKLAKIIQKDYNQNQEGFFIFHTLEFLAFLIFIVSRTALGWQYLGGVILHLFCDGIRQVKKRRILVWLKRRSLAYLFLRKERS